MAYEIVSLDGGIWRNDIVGEDNVFATEAEAREAIAILRTLGDDWAAAEYDVREIEAPTMTCIYCGREVPGSEDDPVPGRHDDEAWAELASHHTDSCEWVETRAHRVLADA